MVWGYPMPAAAQHAWEVRWGRDSASPFAPLVIALVQ